MSNDKKVFTKFSALENILPVIRSIILAKQNIRDHIRRGAKLKDLKRIGRIKNMDL